MPNDEESIKFSLENTDDEQLRLSLFDILSHLRDPSGTTVEVREKEFDAYNQQIASEGILTTEKGAVFLQSLFDDIQTYTLVDEVHTESFRLAFMLTEAQKFQYQGPLADEYYKDIYTVGGVDVSRWQGRMNWDQALSQNVSYAFVRATYSNYYEDNEYENNAVDLNERAVPWAAYHFLVPTTSINNAITEATLYLDTMEKPSHGTMTKDGKPLAVLDLESRGTLVAKSQQLFDYIWKWIDTVEKAGYSIIIYSSAGWMNSNLRQQDIDWLMENYPYWHAQYTTAQNPNLPSGVTTNDHWQYSADGNGLGHKYGASGSHAIDINRWMGTWDEFTTKYMADAEIPPVDPPIDPPDPPVEPPSETTYVVKNWVNGMNVRTGPGTSYASVGSLKTGDEVVLGDMGGSSAWIKIKEGEYAGMWAAVDYNSTRYMDIKE
jgi:lysozyme